MAEAAPATEEPVQRRYEIPVLGETTNQEATPAPAEAPAAPESQNIGDQAPPAQPEGEKPEVKTQEQAAKRGTARFERRLDKAYRERAEAQAQAQFLQKEVAELRARQAPVQDPGAPTLEQFGFDPEKYADAKAKYAEEKAVNGFASKQKAESAKAEQTKLLSDWEAKADRGSEKYEDFDAVVGQIRPESPIAAAIMYADNGDDLAYHLMKNRGELEKIANLPPLRAIIEIGRLSATLAAEPAKPKKPSQAPAPVAPVSGVSSADSNSPNDKDDMKSWIKKRQQQVHGARR